MIFGSLIMLVAITISAIAAWYSVAGLTAIFSAAVIPVIIMGGALEAGKIVATVWLHNNWHRIGWAFKTYLIPAVVFLMLLTSLGIFGFLSKAHSDQSLVTGDATSRVAIYDEKIATERENIAQARRALEQMNSQVDQMLGRSDTERGAERAVQIRRNQARERRTLQAEITQSQKTIQQLQAERAPFAAEARKIEAEVGPIKYIAALIYGDNPDQNVLERSVRWVIILIVIVFDPLALTLILAANKQFEWARSGRGGWVHDEEDNDTRRGEQIYESDIKPDEPLNDSDEQEFFDRARYAALSADILDEQRRAQEANAAAAEIASPEPDLDIPVLENEEMWASRVIDEHKETTEPAEPTVAENAESVEVVQNTHDTQHTSPTFVAEAEPESIEETEPDTGSVDEFNIPVRRGNDYAVRYQGKVYNLDAFNALHPSLAIKADNETLSNASQCGFGDKFPGDPVKGDMFIRTDFLPEKLFKWNGQKWIELDKNSTDSYTYNHAYIQHLIQKLEAGEYEIEDLNEAEQAQVEQQIQTILGKRV